MPHGFSCPKNSDLKTKDKNAFWTDTSELKLHLDDIEIKKRVEEFSNFLLQENYKEDKEHSLNEIVWHNSNLTSDIVSGSLFAGKDAEKLRNKAWVEFHESRQCLACMKLSAEEKENIIANFENMLKVLPFNNFTN